MKTILAILVVIVCASLCLGEELIRYCGPPGLDSERMNNDIKTMNEKRKAFAEQHQIANMQELKYDLVFGEDVKRRFFKCEDLKNGPTWRYHDNTDLDAVRIMKDYFNDTGVNREWELFHPLQTKFIECFISTRCGKQGTKETADKFGKERFEFYMLETFGPRGTFSKSDFKKGPPGSQCPNGKTDIGLCKSPDVKKFKTETSAYSGSPVIVSGQSSETPDEPEEKEGGAKDSVGGANGISTIFVCFFLMVMMMMILSV